MLSSRCTLIRRPVALALSIALTFLGPGIDACRAFAQSLAAPVMVPARGGVSPVAGFGVRGGAAPVSTGLDPAINIRLDVLPGVRNVQVSAAPNGSAFRAESLAAEKTAAPLRIEARNASRAPQAETAAQIGRLSKEVGSAVESVGAIPQAGAEASRALGSKLESVLTRQEEPFAREADFEPSVDGLGDRRGGRRLARPAGQEIVESVREHNRRFAVLEPTPAQVSPARAPRDERSPLWLRVLGAGAALASACFVGWPLLSMMAPLGALNLALALSLAALPFLPPSAPKRLKQLPGFLLAAQGFSALAAMYFYFTAPPAQAGLLALLNGIGMGGLGMLGGWGLARYLGRAAKPGERRLLPDGVERAGAFAAAVVAAAAIGLTLLGVPGLLPAGVKALAYLASPLLLMHLPGLDRLGR